MLLCEKVLRALTIRSVFAALYQFKGTIHFMQCACSGVPQFVIADTPQQAGGLDFGKVQKDTVAGSIPDGSSRLGAAIIGNHIYLVFFAIGVEIGKFKHC